MKRLIILATCVALLPFVAACGRSVSPPPPEGPKKSIEELQKAAAEAREKMKKQGSGS